jgi:uncharacterized protein (DUF1697 family)
MRPNVVRRARWRRGLGADHRRGIIDVVTTRIAFLRAVNLGKRTVGMARLVEIFGPLGFEDVWTHINSGNVVFDGSGPRADIERMIEEALEAEFGFEVTTFVRTATELEHILAAQPFEVAEGDTYFITFLKTTPSATTARALEAASNDFDTLVVRGRDVHWRMHGKSTDTTVKQKDWKIVGQHGSTSRNITMLRKLGAKLGA